MKKVFREGSISKEERETITSYEEETDSWRIYSSVRRHITRLMKIFGEDEITKIVVNENDSVTEIFIDDVSPEQVSFRNKSKPRVMTEEQKQELAERMRKARLSQ